MTYPKFEYIGCVSPNLFINRTDELSKAADTVFNRRMNVFVTGPRTIGKTSFLFKLKEMVEQRHTPRLFPLVFDLSGMYQDYFSDFLPELVAQLSARVAMQFFDLSYSEL